MTLQKAVKRKAVNFKAAADQATQGAAESSKAAKAAVRSTAVLLAHGVDIFSSRCVASAPGRVESARQ